MPQTTLQLELTYLSLLVCGVALLGDDDGEYISRISFKELLLGRARDSHPN